MMGGILEEEKNRSEEEKRSIEKGGLGRSGEEEEERGEGNDWNWKRKRIGKMGRNRRKEDRSEEGRV